MSVLLDDIWIEILVYIPLDDIKNLVLTSRQFYDIAKKYMYVICKQKMINSHLLDVYLALSNDITPVEVARYDEFIAPRTNHHRRNIANCILENVFCFYVGKQKQLIEFAFRCGANPNAWVFERAVHLPCIVRDKPFPNYPTRFANPLFLKVVDMAQESGDNDIVKLFLKFGVKSQRMKRIFQVNYNKELFDIISMYASRINIKKGYRYRRDLSFYTGRNDPVVLQLKNVYLKRFNQNIDNDQYSILGFDSDASVESWSDSGSDSST